MPDIEPKSAPTKEFVFANAFSGATRNTEPPMIFPKLRELRRKVNSVAAVRTKDVPFAVRGAKDLNQKLANALDELNLLAPVIDSKVTLIDVNEVPFKTNRDGASEPVFRTLAHVVSTVRIIAEDGSFVDMVGSGHGGDKDDKAGGKASTYAWKDAILKGLTIPHEDMVDTDDEAATQVTSKPAKVEGKETNASASPSQTSPAPTLPITSVGDEGGFNLAYVLAQIEKATSDDQLSVIRKAVSDGTMALSGGDKLKASTAYVRKREELLGRSGPKK